MSKASRWLLAATLLVFALAPARGQILFEDFQILGCQGGQTSNFFVPAVTGSPVIHTAQPSFSVVVTTTTGSTATGLVGHVAAAVNAAYPAPSLSAISGQQALWKFDGNGNDSSASGRNLTLSGIDRNGTGSCGSTNFSANGKNGPAGLGNALLMVDGGAHCDVYGQQPGAGSNLDFKSPAAFTVEMWVYRAGDTDDCASGAVCTLGTCSGPGGTCSGGSCSFTAVGCFNDTDCPFFGSGETCGHPGCTTACNTSAGADMPLFVSCDAEAADQCLIMMTRNVAGGGCGSGITVSQYTPYFAFYGDDVCGGNLTANVWHHLAFVFDGNAKFIYMDGTLVSGPVLGTQGKYKGNPTSSFIGGSPLGGAGTYSGTRGHFLNGYLDSVRVWNRQLTQGTIASHALAQWYSIAGDFKFDGVLSGPFNPGAGPTTPIQNVPVGTEYSWSWGFGASRNIIPTKAGADSSIAFTFTEEDTNESIGQGQTTALVRQATMSTPPDPVAMQFGKSTTQLTWTIPHWFCGFDASNNPNITHTTYTFNLSDLVNSGTISVNQSSPTYSPSGLNVNCRYSLTAQASYTDTAPGNGTTVGPSSASNGVSQTTFANPPNTPTGVVTTGPTSATMTLHLPISGDGAGPYNPSYTATEVVGSDDGGLTWGTVSGYLAFNAANSNPRTVSGLAKSAKYFFRERNENLDGFQTSSSPATGVGIVTQPATVQNFQGTTAQGTPGLTCPKTQVLWSWNSIVTGSGIAPKYLVTDQGGTPRPGQGSFPACAGCQAGTTFLDTGLTPNTNYVAEVWGFDSGAPTPGPSSNVDIRFADPSSLAFAQTALAANTAPTNVVGVAGVGSISWSWTAPPNLCDSHGYTVLDAHTGAQLTPTIFDASAVVTWVQTPLGANVQSSIVVKASDTVGGFGPLSIAATAYSQAFPPLNLVFASVSTGSMVLSWNANGNPSYTRYEISDSLDNFVTNFSTPVKFTDNLTATSIGVTGLQSGTTYYFRVRAINGQASDPYGTVPTSFAPNQAMTLWPPPSVTGAAVSNASIDWQWPSAAGVSAYNVVRTPPGGVAASFTPVYAATLHHTPVGLNTNTQYGVQVLALNAQGLPSPSPTVNVYTLAVSPTVPANDIVGVTSNTITYQWNPNGNPAGTFYEIDIATNSLFASVITTATPGATMVTIAGLFPQTTYFAELRSFNGDLIPVNPYVVLDSTRTNGDALVAQSSSPATVYQVAMGAVGQWHFDESTGTASADVSGFNNSAALTCTVTNCVSTPTWVSGPTGLNSGINLLGVTGSYARIPDAAQYHFVNDLTVEAWVKPATLAEINGAGIVAKGPFNGEDFFLDISGGKYRFTGCTTLSGGTAVSAASIVPGQWTHVAGVYNSGSGTNFLYVNGALAGSAVCGARTASTAVNVTIGNRLSGTGGYDLGFNGAVDEVRLIHAAFTAGQVAQDYNAAFTSTVTLSGASAGLKLALPPNAFGGPATIYASGDPLNHPLKIGIPQLMLGLSAEPTRQILIPGMLLEIVPIVNGTQFTGPLGSSAAIIIPYTDANNDGLLDGVKPSIAVGTLKAYTLDTTIGQWTLLPSVLDTTAHTITVYTPHFSIFGIFGLGTTGVTTTETRVYPVPWKIGSGGAFDAPTLTFDTLPPQGTLRIFTLAGQKVVDIPFYPANAGKVTWDGNNFNGNPAASGVYFGLIRTSDSSTRVVKFAIER